MNIHESWFTLAKVGLMLNTIGAIVLIIGSNKVVDVLTKFVDTVGPTYGTYGQGAAAPKIKELANDFDNIKKQAKLVNYVGYTFFIVGFVLQLF